ncbi:MAG: hypothetical protein K1W10_15180 [Lachnospiraceae bacterium]
MDQYSFILLPDANILHPTQKGFGKPNSTGFTVLLTGKIPTKNSIRQKLLCHFNFPIDSINVSGTEQEIATMPLMADALSILSAHSSRQKKNK